MNWKYHDYCLLSQYYRKSNIFDNIENIMAILDALLATFVSRFYSLSTFHILIIFGLLEKPLTDLNQGFNLMRELNK